MKEVLIQLIGLAVALVTTAVIVHLLVEADLVPQKEVPVTETNFRAACASVKGVTVWNGKAWECLK